MSITEKFIVENPEIGKVFDFHGTDYTIDKIISSTDGTTFKVLCKVPDPSVLKKHAYQSVEWTRLGFSDDYLIKFGAAYRAEPVEPEAVVDHRKAVLTATDKPSFPPVKLDSIPQRLKDRPGWLFWGAVWKNNKWSKVPKLPHDTARWGSKTKSRDWVSFDEISRLYREFQGSESIDGIYLVLGEGITGIDLDNCVDPKSREIKPFARKILDLLNTYCEYSPTGTGVKAYIDVSKSILWDRIGFKITTNIVDCPSEGMKVECYENAAGFCVTGDIVAGYPNTLNTDADQFFEAWMTAFNGVVDAERNRKSSAPSGGSGSIPPDVSDRRLLDLARWAKNGDKFARLYDEGDISDYGDDASRADFALVAMLAFWTGEDEDRIDSLFRRSALYREKWKGSYQRNTLGKVLKSLGETFDWSGESAVDPDAELEKIMRTAREGSQQAHGATVGGRDQRIPEAGDEPFRESPRIEVTDLLSLEDLQRKAEAIERVWIADQWLQAGHIAVMSGREKRGKSTAGYDLMTAAITGQSWMDHVACLRSPVLLMDYENPPDYVWANIRAMMDQRGGDIRECSPWFGQADPDTIRKLASPVTVEYALPRIDLLQKRTGVEHGLLIIDTAGPAFQAMFDGDANWTNQNTQVRQAIEIGQDIVRRTGWSAIIVYHDNKSGTGAAGSYEWYGTPDVFLRFEREINEPKGYLSISGRLLNPPAPLEFVRQGALLKAQSKGTEAENEKKAKKGEEYLAFLAICPQGADNRRNQGELIELAKTIEIGKNKALDHIKEAVDMGSLKWAQQAINKPIYYWR